jgi:multisubunit Na+/H+ antiporter MnhC subunit
MFEPAENVTIGDYMFTSDNEFEIITSIDIIDESVQTININIEENDVYFADGILVHNFAQPKDQA